MFKINHPWIQDTLRESFKAVGIPKEEIQESVTRKQTEFTFNFIPGVPVKLTVQNSHLRISLPKRKSLFYEAPISNSNRALLANPEDEGLLGEKLPWFGQKKALLRILTNLTTFRANIQRIFETKEKVDVALKEKHVPDAFTTHLCFERASLTTNPMIAVRNPFENFNEDLERGFYPIGSILLSDDIPHAVARVSRTIKDACAEFTREKEQILRDDYQIAFVNLDQLTGSPEDKIEAQIATTGDLTQHLNFTLLLTHKPQTVLCGEYGLDCLHLETIPPKRAKTPATPLPSRIIHDHITHVTQDLVPSLALDLPKYRAAYQGQRIPG